MALQTFVSSMVLVRYMAETPRKMLSDVKILCLVPEALPTFRADLSALFVKYLPRFGVVTHLIGRKGRGDLSAQRYAAVSVSSDKGGRIRREFAYLCLALRALWRTRATNCDVIQVRDMVSIGLLGLVVARMKGIQFVYWMSYLMSEARLDISRERIKERAGLRYYFVFLKGLVELSILYRIVLPGARHVFVQSEVMKNHVARRGIPAGKLTAVPMAVDCELLKPGAIQPQRLSGWDAVPQIAYLGTLNRARRLGVLIDALNIVRQRFLHARLLFIGGTETREDVDLLVRHASVAGLSDAVHVTGWLPSHEAWSLLVGTDVAVSYVPRDGTLDCGSPTKILEYLALAIPCVGNDNPDQATVLKASGAGCLTGSTPDSIAEGICSVLQDMPAARARAANGPGYIERERSYHATAERVARTYRAISSHGAL